MTEAVVDIDRVKHPRDALDVVAILCLIVCQFCVFYGPPSFLTLYLTIRRTAAVDPTLLPLPITLVFPLSLVLPFGLMLAAEAIFNGTGLSLDATGVYIRRLFGGRRLLAPWSEISSIEPVGRLQAWFIGTFIPWRMLGVSTRGAFVIVSRTRHYIVPVDPRLFGQAIQQFRSGLKPLDGDEPRDPVSLLPPAEETGNPYQSPRSDLIDPDQRAE